MFSQNGSRTTKDPIAGQGSRKGGESEKTAGPQCNRPEESSTEGARSCLQCLQGSKIPQENFSFTLLVKLEVVQPIGLM